jgi:Aldo/keto reductase family
MLSREVIDLYQLHTVDPRVRIEESLGAIVDLQREGKVRMISVSNVSVAERERARTVVDLVSVQSRYSVGDQRSHDVLESCQRDGIAFLPWFPLGAGRLARAQELERVADSHGASAAQVAIAWLLQRSPRDRRRPARCRRTGSRMMRRQARASIAIMRLCKPHDPASSRLLHTYRGYVTNRPIRQNAAALGTILIWVLV